MSSADEANANMETKDSSNDCKSKIDIIFIKEEPDDDDDAPLDVTMNDDWTQGMEKAPNLLDGDPLVPDGKGRPDKPQISRKNKNIKKITPSKTNRRKSAVPRKKIDKKLFLTDDDKMQQVMIDIDSHEVEDRMENNGGKQECRDRSLSTWTDNEDNTSAANLTDENSYTSAANLTDENSYTSAANLTDENSYTSAANLTDENYTSAVNATDKNSPGILCFYCDFKCLDESALTQHERVHALNSKKASFQCHACDARFVDMEDMKLHANLRHTVKCYPCKICGEVFRRVDRLRKHMSGSHAGVRPYACTECDLKFSSSSGLNKHAKLHQGKQFACVDCDAKFAYPSKLRTHILTHTGEKPHTCELCDQKFTNLRSLKYHMTSHTGDKPFECNQCHMKFYNSYKLKLHAKTHSFDQPHVCVVCHTRFKHVSSLKGHMRTVHSDAKPFRCEECGACFARKYVLKVHIITHSGEKRFECDQCQAKYGDYSSLKRHRMSIHEGIKPYLCAKCGAGFMRDLELQKHAKRQHSENIN